MRRAMTVVLLLVLYASASGCPETKPDPCPAGTIPVAERCDPPDAGPADASATDAATAADAATADAG